MKNQYLLTGLIIILIIIVASILIFDVGRQSPVDSNQPFVETTTSTTTEVATSTATSTPVASSTTIVVSMPSNNAVVTSPLSIKGKATGGWYFEASFPVTLLDGNGKVLVQSHVDAQGDWMTSEYVPFTATLTFSKPTTATGTLVFKKDNPSGLPQNEASFSVPVTFSGVTTNAGVNVNL